jgi:hypothetical protein
MRTSKPVTVGLAAAMAIAAGGLITQHNQLVAQAEQLTATSYQLEAQTQQLLVQTGRLQAHAEQLSADNVSMQRDDRLASQAELPVVVVSASRGSR